jgi:signal transduction histidine kinase
MFTTVQADEFTPEKVEQMAIKAVAMLDKEGPAAYAKLYQGDIYNKEKDLYVFVIDFNGLVKAHINPNLVGKNLMAIKDPKGTNFTAKFVEIAKGKGQGWTSYWWPKPNQKEASQKITFVKRIGNKDEFAGIGMYDIPENKMKELEQK